MAALLAKRLGARRVVALINRRSYADLMQGGQIDIAISPAQATIGKLLQHIRRGDVVAVHSLRRGAAEALELVAHGDEKTCKVIGKKVEEIQLPRGATIGAIVRRLARPEVERISDLAAKERDAKVIMAHHDTIDLHRRSRDHVRRQQAHDPEGREAVPGRVRLRVAADPVPVDRPHPGRRARAVRAARADARADAASSSDCRSSSRSALSHSAGDGARGRLRRGARRHRRLRGGAVARRARSRGRAADPRRLPAGRARVDRPPGVRDAAADAATCRTSRSPTPTSRPCRG